MVYIFIILFGLGNTLLIFGIHNEMNWQSYIGSTLLGIWNVILTIKLFPNKLKE